MANPRIDDLRKRLEKEPGSRVFAQLAEELRKDGDIEEAIQVCREGLQRHPNYPSARMTLGRALFESGDMSAARTEFEIVLKGAPDNILASRLLGESLESLGDLEGARDRFKKTLAMAPGEKHVAAQLEAVERALKRKVPAPGAATPPAAGSPRASVAGPAAAAEPPPIKLIEVNEPMELERPHEATPVSFTSEERSRTPSPVPAHPPAQEEVVEFDEAPTMAGTPAMAEEVTAAPAPAPEEVARATLPVGMPAPTFAEPEAALPPIAVPSAPEPPSAVREALPIVQPPPEPVIEPDIETEAPAPPEPQPTVQPEPSVEPEEVEAQPRAAAPEPGASEEIASVTLAELYFNQGFADKAVVVLRQLLAREPANERARARLNEIEARETELLAEQQRVAATTGPGADQRALRRRAIERTIAQLERMLAGIRKG